MATFRDPAFREQYFLEQLEKGNGFVSGETWHGIVRVIIEDDAALEQLANAGRAWRRERGMPDEEFIIGVGE